MLIVAAGYLIYDPMAYGFDFRFYSQVGAQWLADGSFYLPHQLAGPYVFTSMIDVVYPPVALPLMVAAAVMPALLWWAIPVGVVLYVVANYHPPAWAGVVMLGLLCWPKSEYSLIMGNTDVWAMAAVAGGLRWGWPAALLAIKPTLLPFALVGVRRRPFWVAAAIVGLVGLAMLPIWSDYVTAMRNLRLDPGYSIGSFPLLVVPVVAWWSRRV